MFDPKKLLLAVIAIFGLGLISVATRAADEPQTLSGILIDNACGARDANKTEAAAAKHPIACAKKESCAQTGYQLIVGDKHLKFDAKGNDLAKEYLTKAKSLKVTIEGKVDADTVAVTSLKATGGK